MIIRGKRIRSIDQALRLLLPNTNFRVAIPIDRIAKKELEACGITLPATLGDTFLPAAIGTVSDFNANGRYEVLKDRPKERRYISTIEWTWQQWEGRHTVDRSEMRDIFRDCYQRKFTPPPSCELTYVETGPENLITSHSLTKHVVCADLNLHVINLFLELFGECEVRHTNLQALIPPQIRRVNWAILPPGTYPWSRVASHVTERLKGIDSRYSAPILFRQQKLAAQKPDSVYCGAAGFLSYLAYIFKNQNITILESLELGNATYIFGQDWRAVSQMTKAEILRDNLQLDRIIHSEGWGKKLDSHFK